MITDILNQIAVAFEYIITIIFIIILLIFCSGILYFFIDTCLSKVIRFFILLTALLLAMGGAFAFLVGLIKLVYDVYVILYINGIKDFDEIFINLIHLAEYLLVGVTFFSIAKRLMVESYFKSEDNAEEARKPINIPDLEKHIIGMVVATISVGFIGFVVSGNAGDITLKFGIGVGAFITSLGLYLKLSSHKNDATVDILRQELMQLRTKDKESNQDGTPTTAELQEGRQY